MQIAEGDILWEADVVGWFTTHKYFVLHCGELEGVVLIFTSWDSLNLQLHVSIQQELKHIGSHLDLHILNSTIQLHGTQ